MTRAGLNAVWAAARVAMTFWMKPPTTMRSTTTGTEISMYNSEKIVAAARATTVKTKKARPLMIGSSSTTSDVRTATSDFIDAVITRQFTAICTSPEATRKPMPGHT